MDPDEQQVELIEETLDLDMLCELLRCESTDMEELGGPYLSYFDGEGAAQERQTEWEFNGKDPLRLCVVLVTGVCTSSSWIEAGRILMTKVEGTTHD